MEVEVGMRLGKSSVGGGEGEGVAGLRSTPRPTLTDGPVGAMAGLETRHQLQSHDQIKRKSTSQSTCASQGQIFRYLTPKAPTSLGTYPEVLRFLYGFACCQYSKPN